MSRSKDLPLYFLLTSLVLLFSYYLSIPLTVKARGHKKVLAHVVSFTNNLKLKRSNSLAWIDLNGPNSLKQGDKLFTHENARARIKYINGIEIEIEPSTLVKISDTNDQTIIDIEMGFISLSFKNAKKQVTIRAEKESLTINAKESQLNVVEVNSLLAVNVTKGAARVKKNSLPKPIAVNAGEILTQDNEVAKINPLTQAMRPKSIDRIIRIVDDLPDTISTSLLSKDFKVISPLDFSEKYLYEEEIEIKFDWLGSTSNSDFIVSRYPDMTRTYMASDTNLIRPISLNFKELGLYYWKIGDGPRYSFSIKKNPPLKKPQIEKIVDLKNLSKKKELYRIKWKSVKFAKFYMLNIYSDSKAKNLTTRTMVEEPSVLWKADIVDSLFYTVTAIDRWNNPGETSEIGKLVSPISPFEKIIKKGGK